MKKKEGIMEQDSTSAMKSLLVRQNKSLNSIKVLTDERDDISEMIKKEKTVLNKIADAIRRLTYKEVVVSEHAKLRYLEKIMDINLDDITKSIVSESLQNQVRMLGDGTYPSSCKRFKIKVKNGVVITIV